MRKKNGHYQYVRAIKDGPELSFEYRLHGAKVAGAMSHDEDVSDWSDEDIRKAARAVLDIEADDPVSVEVQHA